jgi:hypothetical protein
MADTIVLTPTTLANLWNIFSFMKHAWIQTVIAASMSDRTTNLEAYSRLSHKKTASHRFSTYEVHQYSIKNIQCWGSGFVCLWDSRIRIR